VKEIKLTKNKISLIDDEDFEKVSKYKWHCLANNYAARKFYYEKKDGKWITKYIRLHQFILNEFNKEIDHVNGNRLDNRKENLRLCTRSLNNANSIKKTRKGGTTSKYKGVTWNKNASKWMVQAKLDNIGYYLGLFTDEIEAAKAYNKKAKELFGDFARLNQL
jgi:hypothetical protein